MGYQLIETIEVGAGGAASIEFTGIPQDGVDLQVVVSGRSDGTSESLYFRFNSDTGTNYAFRYLRGNGSSVASFNNTLGFGLAQINNSTSTANTFNNCSIYIPNYTSSSSKTTAVDLVTENNATAALQFISASSWTGTAAISTITLSLFSANFVQYSTASLYKITAD